jgi:predicted phosphate transport protein (TIGR00153 family)
MPVGGYMSGIFGSSPVDPMQTHMAKVYACASELIPLFNAVIVEDWEKVEQLQQKISKLEREADVLKKELRLNLPKGLFMPMSRQDLLDVLLTQDKIANKSKDIAGVVFGRKMILPEIIHEDYMRFVQRCVDACKQAKKAINEMDELVETGFSGQ